MKYEKFVEYAGTTAFVGGLVTDKTFTKLYVENIELSEASRKQVEERLRAGSFSGVIFSKRERLGKFDKLKRLFKGLGQRFRFRKVDTVKEENYGQDVEQTAWRVRRNSFVSVSSDEDAQMHIKVEKKLNEFIELSRSACAEDKLFLEVLVRSYEDDVDVASVRCL
eukprot:snap_masked-scaffold_7-processed-gene-18.19-mRNA-1 protein AED:1.00 eAED:1.00 QI:0/-1/0/0/-1/1/1/0/165